MTVALEHPCKPEVLALGGTSIRREVVGQFQFGCVIDNRPVALPDWRVTTDDSGVAAEVARIVGGRTESALINGSDPLEVVTESPSVQVGPGGIATHMKLWGSRGLMHHCDGVVFLSPDGARGRPCGCPRLMADRKEQAKLGRGPQSNTVAIFRLAGNYDMGDFRFQSISWKLAETVRDVRGELAALDDSTLCELSLEAVEFGTKSGRRVSYYKPVVKALGPWRLEGAG
ncbi:hypothetical protein ACH4SK_39780 [Streptomyces inhibens]|uniref:recombination directionality factor n=1 Tax=Streptomyces inhibens TaxID=2293571 RepID=UPI00379EF845